MTKPQHQKEFVVLMAVLFATIAISIDAMLPALPEIAATLSPGNPNRAQLVITSFVFGMGIGTLFSGPLADAFGRKPVIAFGAAVFILGALGCYFATSLDMLLAARLVQGLGAAAPRVVGTAMMRDLFKGRDMARIMSLVMTVFMLVPAVAPLLGQGIIHLAGWQAIFLVYIVFSAFSVVWLWLRQPETLAVSARRPLSLGAIWAALREMFTHRIVVISILAQSFILAALFSTLSSMQGIFDQQFGRASSFPMWFAVIALASAIGSIFNAKMVMRLGMRRLITAAFQGMAALSLIMALTALLGIMPAALAFPAHLIWTSAMFASMGLAMGNLNALALEDLGHIAGAASTAITAISTVVSVLLAIPVGLMFDGTALPLYAGVLVFFAAGQLALRFDRPKMAA